MFKISRDKDFYFSKITIDETNLKEIEDVLIDLSIPKKIFMDLMAEAKWSFRDEGPNRALNFCNLILKLNPDHKEAIKLKEKIIEKIGK